MVMKSLIKEHLKRLILEVSKKDILINKVGLSLKNATLLDELCGPLSVWMANKLIDHQLAGYYKRMAFAASMGVNLNYDLSKTEMVNSLNNNYLIGNSRQDIVSIMDFIRIGLNGNISPVKNLTFEELIEKFNEWHDHFGDGEYVNYTEENPIVLDYRDKEGIGFYWVNLETNKSTEECKRMGHCGHSPSGILYSLRENKKIPGTKYTVNNSISTASIGKDNMLYQLKGPKNSKPKEEYHQYILPLFYVEEDGEYLIQGFGSEYRSDQDFKLSDLPNNVLIDLYKNRPELFGTRSLQRKLVELGIIEKPEINYMITLEISPDDVGRYVDGDYLVSQRRQNKEGKYVGRDVGLFETILSGDVWDLWKRYSDNDNWKYDIDYSNKENMTKIEELIKKMAIEEMGEDFDEEEFDFMDIEEKLKEYDSNWDIRSAISSTSSDAQADDYVSHLLKELRSALEELGTVEKMDDTGVTLHIDMRNYLDNVSEEYLDEILDNCDDDLKCVFDEIKGQEFELPNFSIDDRWTPDIDERFFNEMLDSRLSEIG
jgi:hypothetical protein